MTRASGSGGGVAWLDERAARKGKGQQEPQGEGSSHHHIAQALIERWTEDDGGVRPVAAEGSIYRYRAGLWVPVRHVEAEVEVGQVFGGQPKCAKKSDFVQIARHTHDMLNTDPDFFEAAPLGVATPAGFHSIQAGEIQTEELKPEHRQRFVLAASPAPGVPERWMAHLERSFHDDDFAGQHKLLQQVFGAVLFGLLPKHQRAVLLQGTSAGGKSTTANVLSALVPTAFQTAVSPFAWAGEYYIATLAGKRLNMVGELPAEKLIPDADFKRVIGGDLLQGRHPNHRPFEFRNTAAHVFNSNTLPQTRDKSDAFFRRWLIVRFRNPLSAAERVPDFDRQVIEHELPQIIQWAMYGALSVAEAGFTESAAHREVLRKWRLQSDSALAFLADDAAVIPDPESNTLNAPLRSEVYRAYRDWCHESEKRPLGKSKFFESIDGANIFDAGQRVEITRAMGEWKVLGIKLLWGQG